MPTPADALERFSEPTREWFAAAFAEPTPAQQGAWEAIAHGPARPGGGADRLRQDAERVPVEHRPAADRGATQGQDQADPGALRQPAQGARGRRRAQPALAAGRHPQHRRAAGRRRSPRSPSGSGPATRPRPTAASSSPVPPDILITTPESLFLMLTSQARESLRGVETVIVDEVHAVAGTKRGAHLAITLERLDALLDKPAQRIGLSATVRPLEEVARFLGGQAPVEIVAPPSKKEWDLKVVVPVEDMTQPERVRRRGRGRRPQPVDLAARRGVGRRPDRAAQQHHRLRQQPPAERAADRPAQRDRHHPRRRAARQAPRVAGRGHGPVGRQPRRRDGDRQGPPRLGQQGAARPHRGRPQARPAAGRGRDQQPRARHRHGRGRPRRPDRVAAERRQRPPAGGTRRPPGRRGQPRRALPQAPRRPRPDRGRRPADAHRRDRVPAHPDQPARRARPAGRRHGRPRRGGRRRPLRPGPADGAVRQAARGARTTPRSTCSAAATPPTSSPSSGRGSCGTG